MLKLKNITKKFNKRVIYKNLNYSFSNNGFYSIVGKSGCGKTTLLNIIGGLDNDYEGNVIFKEEIKIAMIFQSYNLFENDTVLNNILLSSNNSKNENLKIDDLLDKFSIFHLKNKPVKELSGGEKQRVAIVRALITQPNILLCDEPTGSLDNKNSEYIFEMLKKISQYCLVIVVTHDKEMANKYSDVILKYEDCSLIENIINPINTLNFIKENNDYKNKIKFSFIFNHFKNYINSKKIKSIFSNIFLSVALILFGVNTLLSTTIKDTLSTSLNSIIGQNAILFKRKDGANKVYSLKSAEKEEIYNISNAYNDDILNIGTTYLGDFESHFSTQNGMFLISKEYTKELNEFTLRTINEYEIINEEFSENVYPNLDTNNLNNDEIILGINFNILRKICDYFELKREYEDLGNYIDKNNVLLSFKAENPDWHYKGETIFKLKGIVRTDNPVIFHTSYFFNEYVFEKELQFSSSTNLEKVEQYPWIYKKIYYLKTKKFQDEFLNKIMFNSKFKSYIFENNSSNFCPLTYGNSAINYTNRLYVFKGKQSILHPSITNEISKLNPNFNNYYFSILRGYYNSGNHYLSGFGTPTMFSTNLEKLNEFIDSCTVFDNENFNNIRGNSRVLVGNMSNNHSENVTLKCLDFEVIEGRNAQNINEIVVSSSMAKKLNIELKNNPVLYISNLSESQKINNHFFNKFRTISLRIVGISSSKNYEINHNKNFSISLFRDLFQYSAFTLFPDSVVYEFSNKIEPKEVKIIGNYFKDFTIIDTQSEISNTVNESMYFLNIILLIFSLITFVTALTILIIVNFTELVDLSKDFAILYVLGFSLTDRLKFNLIELLLKITTPVASSIFSIFCMNIVIKKILGNMLGTNVNIFSIPFESILIILLISFLAVIIVMIFSYFYIKNMNYIKFLHQI